jgi:phosphatidate cytidylyltransferase
VKAKAREKNRNLLLRVGTAVVLLPAVLWLLWKGDLPFALLISVAAAACAFELNQLPLQGKDDPITGAAIASTGAAFLIPLLHHAPLGFLSVEMVLVVLVAAACIDALFFEPDVTLAPRRVGLAVMGAVYGGVMLSALVKLRQLPSGAVWIFLALAVTWANDTGGYFAGRAFGKHKLYPRISPSKTVEGAIGGMAFSVLWGLGVFKWGLPDVPLWGGAVIGLGASILGPLGDLSESAMKRAYGAKDSGKLLPGHGGMLDRLDALLFTAPFVLLCARWLIGK